MFSRLCSLATGQALNNGHQVKQNLVARAITTLLGENAEFTKVPFDRDEHIITADISATVSGDESVSPREAILWAQHNLGIQTGQGIYIPGSSLTTSIVSSSGLALF